jgi:hypothetical protein
MYEGPRITLHHSCSHLVIPGPGCPFPAFASWPALLTLGVKLSAAGLQCPYSRCPPSTAYTPILAMNIFVALVLDILHIHAYE